MAWTDRKYQINLEDGTSQTVAGKSNGVFGITAHGTLTHLGTGYKIARFRDVSAAMHLGDYLAERYTEQIKALNADYRKSLTHEEVKKLPSVKTLDDAVRHDERFQSIIKKFAILQEGKDE